MLRKLLWSVKIGLVNRGHDCYNEPMNDGVRSPFVAGTFYPSRPEQLLKQIDQLLADPGAGKQDLLSSSLGLVVPHAGYLYSGGVAAAGFQQVANRGKPEVIVILGANHTGTGHWFALSPHSAWATPLGQSPVDKDVMTGLMVAGFKQEPAPFAREHSIEVQLPFIQQLWGTEVPIVPICVSPAPLDEISQAATALVEVLADRKVLVIASSDFTHYQPDDVARSLDSVALDHVLALDVAGFHQLCGDRGLTICGTGAIEVLMTVAREMILTVTRVVSYATSGDVANDRTSVVGYASVLLAKENNG